jgi:hypothetical protein
MITICEYCAETIKSAAKVCRYCGRDVAPTTDGGAKHKPQLPANEIIRTSSDGDASYKVVNDIAAPKEQSVATPTLQSALKTIGAVLLGIASLFAVVLLTTFWVEAVDGVAWLSEKIFWSVFSAATIAFWICVSVLLPLSLFETTRKISFFGMFGGSYIFGLCTWILGFLATYEYWGGFGVFVGVGLLGIGIVPVGILASTFQADWFSVICLIFGLALTYGARVFAMWLAKKIDSEASAAAVRAASISAKKQTTESGSTLASLRARTETGASLAISLAALALAFAIGVGLLGQSQWTPTRQDGADLQRRPLEAGRGQETRQRDTQPAATLPSSPARVSPRAEATAAYEKGDLATAFAPAQAVVPPAARADRRPMRIGEEAFAVKTPFGARGVITRIVPAGQLEQYARASCRAGGCPGRAQ